jgi:hypothetical protein
MIEGPRPAGQPGVSYTLGVSGARRSPTLPEVPTIGEAALAGFPGSVRL